MTELCSSAQDILYRGIGFAIARQLCLKLAQGDLYLTTRGDTESLNIMLR